ncbi:MAG: hypothetical protein ACJ79M_19310 [Myxococcales bacterium]
MRVAILLAILSAPALAWEPSGVASVDERIAELRKAWEGKDPGAILQDKLQRAKQPQRPEWVTHKAWYIEEKGRRLYFGVGVSPKLPQGALESADFGGVEAKAGAPAPLDWYYDAKASVLYVLIVDERQ